MQGRDVVVTVVVVVAVLLLFGLLGGGMMTMMVPWMMGGYWGFGSWWGIAMILFWFLVIVGGVLLVAWLFRQGQPAGIGPGGGPRSPLDILKERYARGEITKEQYDQMRRDLE